MYVIAFEEKVHFVPTLKFAFLKLLPLRNYTSFSFHSLFLGTRALLQNHSNIWDCGYYIEVVEGIKLVICVMHVVTRIGYGTNF